MTKFSFLSVGCAAILVLNSACSIAPQENATLDASDAALSEAAQNVEVAADAAIAAADATLASSTLSLDSKASLCKAAIAELNGHSPKIMKASAQSDDKFRISYRRPDDGKQWTNDCKLAGNRIIWRTVNGSPGRWRTDIEDEVLTYTIDDKIVNLTTTYSDGSKVTNKQPML